MAKGPRVPGRGKLKAIEDAPGSYAATVASVEEHGAMILDVLGRRGESGRGEGPARLSNSA